MSTFLRLHLRNSGAAENCPVECYYYYYNYFIIIIIVVVVVVVDDGTYCWVYLSSDHPFQVCCKVRQRILLQSATAFFITECDKCYYKVPQLLQSATEQTI